jgi:NADPH-dependent 7-cyano-7-deazaguanine reductase QueF
MAPFEINPVTNPRKDRSYWAILSTEEPLPCRSADCGVDGHASISLRYQPTELCIETRSFGRYLSHLLREAELDQELLHRIAKEVLSSCHPATVAVEAHFESPEGMSLSLSVTHPESHS